MAHEGHLLSRSQTTEAQPAIPASHIRLAEEIIYHCFVQWPIWSTFDRVWLHVDGPLPHPADGPIIAYMNHCSWWDGYIPLLFHREVFDRQFENYLMMDYRQLRRYRFFAWIGAFSVTINNRREAARSVAYITQLLATRQDRFLWIYPQGKIVPNDRRPIVIHRGIARIARQAGGVLLWPIALRYEFRGEQRPEAFIRAGPAHYAPPSTDTIALTADIQQRLTMAVDTLHDEVIHDRLDHYRELARGRPGTNRIFDAIMNVLLRQANT